MDEAIGGSVRGLKHSHVKRRTSLPEEKENRYKRLLEHIFFDKDFGAYKKGTTRIEFERDDLESAARALKFKLPKNPGDVIYSQRYRTSLPKAIVDTQPKGMEWIIDRAGRARYRFCLVPSNKPLPRSEEHTSELQSLR